MDIKKVIADVKAAGATIYNDVQVKNVSISVAATGSNVEYWCTLTVNQAIDGMINDGDAYKKGLTTTVIVPLGTVVTMLFDALDEMATDDALDLGDYRKAILADAAREAKAPIDEPYVSWLHKLVRATKINIIARPVTKGKVKSLFSLNEKEVEVEHDSIWHDIYTMTNVREKVIANALEAMQTTNATLGNKATAAKASLFDEIAARYAANSAAGAVSAGLA